MTKLDLKQQTHDALAKLHTLADEVRLRSHLAGMEAKQKWNEVEPQLLKLEQSAHHASEEVLKSLHELTAKIEELGGWLSGSHPGDKESTVLL